MTQVNIANTPNINGNDVAINVKSISLDASKVPNVLLKRLIEEVQFENRNNILAYDRAHNRHNRGR